MSRARNALARVFVDPNSSPLTQHPSPRIVNAASRSRRAENTANDGPAVLSQHLRGFLFFSGNLDNGGRPVLTTRSRTISVAGTLRRAELSGTPDERAAVARAGYHEEIN
jgi:hypothetical protein